MAVFIGGVLAWEKPTYNGLHYPGTAFFLHAVKNDPNAGYFLCCRYKNEKNNKITTGRYKNEKNNKITTGTTDEV